MATKPDETSLECVPCSLKFSSNHELNQHLITRKHRKQVDVQNNSKCGVYIAGFPYNKSKEHALQYFSKFGGIRKSIVGPTMSYMIIVYEKEEETQSVLSTEHFMDGRKLRVDRSQPRTFIHTENQDHEIHKKLIQELGTIASFNNQIKKFLMLMTPDPQQIWHTYNLVNYDIQRALYQIVPPFKIFNFGSSTTSIQFNSSDLDIYLDFGGQQPTDIKKSLKTIRSGLSKSRLFHNIIDIPSAKVPIVKFVHSQTGIKGDINIVNKIGVENSRLIRYFLSLDDRLRQVILVIKYWAKNGEISGRNHLFTSYSIVMMFIFYLQQRYSFPSVHELQLSTKPTDPEVIWNINITPIRNMKKINKIKSVSTLNILQGFFEYYANFDYKSRIICPYLGKTVDKQYFEDINTVPTEFQLYKKNLNNITPLDCKKPVCLQDPFELNINTCKIIFDNILERFVTGCFSAIKVLSGDQRNMMVNLFSTLEISTATQKKTEMKGGDDPDVYNISLNKPNVLNYLKSESGGDLTELWFKHTLDYCQTVLEKVLRLELTPIENSKCARVGDQQDIHDYKIKKFHATSYVNVWASRNKNPEGKDLSKNYKTSLDKEIAISASIWEENKEIRPSTPIFECNIVLTCLKEPARIDIKFTKLSSYKKIYKNFGNYINIRIPQWFLAHTKELKRGEILK